MSLFKVYLEKSLREFKHYKISTIGFFLAPLFMVLKWYFTGEFVKEIIFYDHKIKYLYFLIFSMLISDLYYQGYTAIIRRFYSKTNLYECLLKGFHKVMFYKLSIYIFDSFLSNLLVILVILFFFSIDLYRFIISILLSFLLIIPSIALGLIVTPLLLYFKGREIDVVKNYLYHISEILVPVMFSFYLFPNYELIAILVPTVGIVEEIRKFLFFGEMKIEIFVASILVSIVYFIVGVVIFIKVLNYARLKGWIGLE